MEIFRKLSLVLLFSLIIFSFGIIHTVGQHEKQIEKSPTEILEEAYSMLVSSSLRSWDMAKSYINQLQHKYFPPNVDFRSSNGVKGNAGAREMMKEATHKSKETVEESAKSAADMLDQQVQKPAENSVSGEQKTETETHDEI